MEQEIENKTEIKKRLIDYYFKNKIKIFAVVLSLISIFILSIIFTYNKEKKNILIADKYLKAGIFLSNNNKDDAKNLYEEVVLSKNKFYSILALNVIIEKDLVKDKEKILNFFKEIENLNISEEKKDLLMFKKALYLIKISKNEDGKKLLNNLIDKNSKLKPLIEEIIAN